MTKLETELQKVTKLKQKGDRQAYLREMAKSLDRMSDEDFDSLSDEAAHWYRKACDAAKAGDEIPDFEAAPLKKPKKAAPPEPDDEAEGESEILAEAEAEPEAEPEPEAKRPARKPRGKKAKKDVPLKPLAPRTYDDVSGEKDRFGTHIGTKAHTVNKLLEEGATAARIDKEVGGRFYNHMRALRKDGHLLEKLPDNIWKLTHRDDIRDPKPEAPTNE